MISSATRLADEAEAARAAASASVADLERRIAAGEATQEDLDRARRRAIEAAAEAKHFVAAIGNAADETPSSASATR